MNSKEKTVIIFLCATFLIGCAVSFFRNNREKRNLGAVQITKRDDDTVMQIQDDTFYEEEENVSDQSMLVNINTASNKELEALSGIGPVIANRIIEYRKKNGSFKTKEEILKVSGIGAKKFAGIKDKIVTE